MKRDLEAFQSKPDQSGETEPERGKENGSDEKEGRSYEEYKTLGGTLSQTEYENVVKRAADETILSYPARLKHTKRSNYINFMAQAILPSGTATIYGILRDEKSDPAPDSVKEHYSTMDDHKLVAEALRIIGDKRSLIAFTEKYPHTLVS
jgi:hypothetical protein